MTDKNKSYQRTRNWLTLCGLALTLAMLSAAIFFRWTDSFHAWAFALTQSRYGAVLIYFLIFSIYSTAVTFPFSFYSGFILEHRYCLSNQKFPAWLGDWAKKSALSFVFSAALVLALYALIWNWERSWWLWAWAAYAAVTWALGKLFPVLIIPLFYKYSPIQDEALRRRIEDLALRFGIAIQNVYSLNLSKTTKKANAAFTGFGKTKRVILGDTLLNSFTHDEIETVLAHELGHFKHKDIWKQFALGTVLSFFGFWIAFHALDAASRGLGYFGAADLRALPLLFLIFFLFGLVVGPVGNAFSRMVEQEADEFALIVTGNLESFISAMRKLAETNLADPNPHPVIEFLLYDHPSIGRRIKFAEEFKPHRFVK